MGKIHLVQKYMVSVQFHSTLGCKFYCRKIAKLELEVIEEIHGKIQLANSLSWLNCRREHLVLCISPFTRPIKLLAGMLVVKYNSSQKTDVGSALETVAKTWQTLL